MAPMTAKPMTLIILDGWGYSENPEANAIYTAHTPVWDKLWATAPHTLLQGSGCYVGLPDEQMGNSEVGHLNMGAGRVVYQDYTRIEAAINDGSFATNPAFITTLKTAVAKDKAVHVLGLLSPGGVHSHEQHIFELLKLAVQQGVKKLYLHAFLDGRDTPPRSALASLERAQQLFNDLGQGHIASISGRFYAMDRDNRWDRVQKVYELLTTGAAAFHYPTAIEALNAAYARDENDEFVQASAIHAAHQKPVVINEGDAVIFMNFRADRARELSRCFTEVNFAGFARQQQPCLTHFTTLTHYATDIEATVAFDPMNLNNTLGEYLAKLGLKQLRIAETEKYAHVTFFFNGGREEPFADEERILVPSPKVATYDLQPEMSAIAVTDKLIEAIHSAKFDVIICNFANADMVGHTGDFAATVKAIETLDSCIGRIHKALQEVSGELLITADHGNAEKMRDAHTEQPHTAHTSEPVPFIYSGRPAHFIHNNGRLSDVAPTLLKLLGVPIPVEMTGHALIELQ